MLTGETLRLLRYIKGIKQKTFAEKLGISQPAYSKLEKSKKISEKKMKSILQILNCSDHELEEYKKFLYSETGIQ